MAAVVLAPVLLVLLASTSAYAVGAANRGVAGKAALRTTTAAGYRPPGITLDVLNQGAGTFNIHNYNFTYPTKCIGIDANGWAGSWDCTDNYDQIWHWRYSIAPGWDELQNGDGLCLGVDSSSMSAGARLRGWTCNGNHDQYWGLQPGPFPDTVYLVNYNSLLIVGVAGGSTANGAPVVQWWPQGHLDQAWY
jgi:hypothetical protein